MPTPFTTLEPAHQVEIARCTESIKTIHDYLLTGGSFMGFRVMLLSMDEQFRRVAALPVPANTPILLDNPLSDEAAGWVSDEVIVPDDIPQEWLDD